MINHKENILEKEVLGLLDGTGGELKISYLNGTYKVKEINTFTVSEDINNVFRVDLTFVCEPFRHLDETVIPLKTNNNNINVDGNVETDHITTIYGNGDISLFINNEQIVFKDVIGYITIDTERMICYKDSTPANNKMIGEFIKLKSGLNTISWIGTVTTVEIKYRGRFLN